MPLYICNAQIGVIADDAKPKIAKEITDIHCEKTGAPSTFVHLFFFEEAPLFPLDRAVVRLHGTIRAGRNKEQKESIILEMRQSVSRHSGIDLSEIEMTTSDVPASWVMEGGDLLPEPGEEGAWLKAHEAKLAVESRNHPKGYENS